MSEFTSVCVWEGDSFLWEPWRRLRGGPPLKNRDVTLLTKVELWCWRRLESPLDCKEIQPVNPKGNQA